MIKITLNKVLILILIMIPLTAYVDTIRTGTYPFQQYLAICLWEAGILVTGIVIGGIIINWNKTEKI